MRCLRTTAMGAVLACAVALPGRADPPAAGSPQTRSAVIRVVLHRNDDLTVNGNGRWSSGDTATALTAARALLQQSDPKARPLLHVTVEDAADRTFRRIGRFLVRCARAELPDVLLDGATICLPRKPEDVARPQVAIQYAPLVEIQLDKRPPISDDQLDAVAAVSALRVWQHVRKADDLRAALQLVRTRKPAECRHGLMVQIASAPDVRYADWLALYKAVTAVAPPEHVGLSVVAADQTLPPRGQRSSLLENMRIPLRDNMDSDADPLGGRPDRGKRTVRFFASTAQGRRIVYLVDRSDSMHDLFSYAKDELTRSVSQLSGGQEFHVIFFSRGEPVENPPKALVPATAANKKALDDFLDDVKTAGQTAPLSALRRAFQVTDAHGNHADLIYLLTDGEFDPDLRGQIKTLQAAADKPIPIHTIALVYRSGERLLKQIAAENTGTYRFISRDDLAP